MVENVDSHPGQALRDMLEILPRGASKGKGVAKLLEHLGVDPARVMAMGEQAELPIPVSPHASYRQET